MKKALAAFLILALGAFLSGCGSGGGGLEEAISGVVDRVESGLDTAEEQLDRLEDKLNGTSGEEPEATEAPASEQSEAAAKATEGPAEQSDETADGTIRPEIKEAIDGYEAFFNEYAEFMEKYDASDSSLGMMSYYLSMLQRYTESTESFAALEDTEMNDAELQYYAEASLRISQTLLSVAN